MNYRALPMHQSIYGKKWYCGDYPCKYTNLFTLSVDKKFLCLETISYMHDA